MPAIGRSRKYKHVRGEDAKKHPFRVKEGTRIISAHASAEGVEVRLDGKTKKLYAKFE